MSGRAPMRVAVVHNLRQGGARRTMAEHLDRAPWETREFCLGTAVPVTAMATVVPLRRRAPAAPSWARPPLRYADLATLLWAWSRLARQVDAFGPDAVIVHPCQYLQAPAALRQLSAPTLYFCHEPRRVFHEPAALSGRRRATKELYAPLYAAERALDLRATAAASVLATNSRYTAGEIRRIYGREATVVGLGVPASFRPGLTPERPRHLLSVGTLIESKGHDLAVRAAARAAWRWPLVIVTPREAPAEAARLTGLAREHGVELSIRVGISDEDLLGLYRSALTTLYLARAEPLGLVALEAQACGCPVIVSAEGGLPETILQGRSGWAVLREPEAVARAIDRLGEERVRGAAAAEAARWGARFTWDSSAAQMEALVQTMLA